MTRCTCFILTPSGVSAPQAMVGGLAGFATIHTGSSAGDFAPVADQVDFLVTYGGGNPKRLLEPMEIWPERLRWISHSGIGVDQFLFPRLAESDIVVTNMRGVSIYAVAMAEFAFAAIALFAKKLLEVERNRASHQWSPVRHSLLQGKTFGVIGLGTIGQELAKRALAFDMNVVATRRNPGHASLPGVTVLAPSELDRLLADADYLAICAPRTAETHNLIGAGEIAVMKPGSVIVNVARGGMVNELALVDALESGHLAGAALDVFEAEPLPPDSPLWTAPNLFLSPHMSANVDLVSDVLAEATIDNAKRFLAGEPLLRIVDKLVGY